MLPCERCTHFFNGTNVSNTNYSGQETVIRDLHDVSIAEISASYVFNIPGFVRGMIFNKVDSAIWPLWTTAKRLFVVFAGLVGYDRRISIDNSKVIRKVLSHKVQYLEQILELTEARFAHARGTTPQLYFVLLGS